MELRKIFERVFSKGGDLMHRRETPTHTLAKMRLASHPEARPSSLMKLSKHNWESVVARVAENTNTPAEVLVELATHAHPDVRIALTENPNTPTRILVILAADESADVRYSLAENPNAPLAVLALLCDDENPYVADRATKTLARIQQARYSSNSTGWFPFIRQRQQDVG